MRTTPTPTQAIPEDRISGILARAAELDRDRRESITVDALRTAALDAGISMAAVDAALAEYAAGATLPATSAPAVQPAAEKPGRFARLRRFLGRLKGPAKLGALMFMVGLTGAAGEGAVALGWMVWLFVFGRLILKRRPSRRARGFILRVVVMTLALGLGSAAAEVDEDAIAILFGMAAPLLVAGTLAIKVRLPKRWRRSSGELTPAAS